MIKIGKLLLMLLYLIKYIIQQMNLSYYYYFINILSEKFIEKEIKLNIDFIDSNDINFDTVINILYYSKLFENDSRIISFTQFLNILCN